MSRTVPRWLRVAVLLLTVATAPVPAWGRQVDQVVDAIADPDPDTWSLKLVAAVSFLGAGWLVRRSLLAPSPREYERVRDEHKRLTDANDRLRDALTEARVRVATLEAMRGVREPPPASPPSP